jgi:hypothetical protein
MESTLLFKTQSFMPSRFTKKYFEMLEKMPPKIRSEVSLLWGYFDIDGQSVWAGNIPRLSKDQRTKFDTHIENRNVCG